MVSVRSVAAREDGSVTSDPAVAAALQEIADRNAGRLTPEDVVKEAFDPGHPLHPFFTWDDEEAALERRLEQARSLIRSVRVVFSVENRQIRTVCFLRDPEAEPREQGYVSLASLRSDKQRARDAVMAEFGRADAALKRARNVAAALDLAAEVDVLIENLQRVQVQAEARA